MIPLLDDIDVRGLSRRYGSRWALIDVAMQVPRGETVMIAGRNGSGKSTLFRVLATAIRPDGGRVAVGGFDVVRQREDVRTVTALLTHHSYLYESLTAKENLSILGLGDPCPILERVGLSSRSNDQVSTFSAGMRKRLSLARLLLQKPQVALLDEPYGQLDPPGFELVDGIIHELRARGATVLMATHQLTRGAALSDRAWLLDAGRVAWSGAAAEIPSWS